MQGLKGSFSNIPYAFILLLFSSVGIMQLYQGPLEDPTPSSEVNAGISPIDGHQKIPARIWEDPFESAHNLLKSKARLTLDTSTDNMIKGIFAKLISAEDLKEKISCDDDCFKELKNKIHFYAIPMAVDGWSSSQEARIKRRYAAHMALYRQGYIPAQSSSIHSLCLDHKPHKLATQEVAHATDDCWPHEYLHYEILTHATLANKNNDTQTEATKIPETVVLFWIRNSQVSEDPGEFLKQFSLQTLNAVKRNFATQPTTQNAMTLFDFVAFWPPTSGGLEQVKKMSTTRTNDTNCPELTFRLVNYSATAPNNITNNTSLYPASKTEPSNEKESLNDSTNKSCDNQFNLRLTFDTTIANDSLVINELLDELMDMRGFSSQKSVFVLVTEWENIYSRKMANEFKSACKLRQPEGLEDIECKIYRFPYISGISGDSSYALNSTIVKTKASDKSAKQQEIRLPIGSSQYDYIRRLTHNFNERLVDKRNTVFALFGSNFDDKLLVLQAIRETNKESTIITTDMNVLYASLIRKFPIRNLLIGSSFSLRSEDEDKDSNGISADDVSNQEKPNINQPTANNFSTIHFRDNYQTSLFRAITRSLEQQQGLLFKDDEISKNIKLYEVGKSNFIPLSNEVLTGSSNESLDESSGKSSKQSNWSNDENILLQNIIISFFALAALTSFVWLKASIHQHAEFNRPGALSAFERTVLKSIGPGVPFWKRIGALLVVYMIFFNMLFILFAISGRFTVESPELFSGISIWISEVGRALAIIVILFSVTVSWTKLKHWRDRVSKRYINQTKIVIRSDWNPLVFMNNELLTKEEDHIFNRIKFEKSWYFFRNQLSARNISIKSFYILAIFVGLGSWVYYSQYGGLTNIPAHPIARGNVAALYDRFFAGVSNIFLILQISYVIVITYICGRLVSHLSRGIIEWPQVYIDKLKTEYSKNEDVIKSLFSEYQGIKLIGNLTNTIGPQVVIPFVALFLIIVTRNTYFDNWNYPVSFLFFFSISGLCLLACAIWLRMLAKKAKKNALDRLIIQKTRYLNDSEKLNQVDYVIELIHDYRKGAFSGWQDNPVVAAIILPISSIIGINVIPW